MICYGIDDLDWVIVDSVDYGFVKVLMFLGKDIILGVIIVGEFVFDLISEYVLVMKYGLGFNKIFGIIYIYLIMVEVNKFVVGEWKKVYKLEGLLCWVECFYGW